jgi:hypothetical protein
MNSQIIRQSNNLPATQTHLIMALGKERSWPFSYLGNAPLLDRPVQVGEWWLVPAQQDTSLIPGRALYRIQTIYRLGLRPAGWVVAHEAPKLLSAPDQKPKKKPNLLPYLAVLGGLGWLLASTLTTVALVDPILIAITPEGDWIEIDRWAS